MGPAYQIPQAARHAARIPSPGRNGAPAAIPVSAQASDATDGATTPAMPVPASWTAALAVSAAQAALGGFEGTPGRPRIAIIAPRRAGSRRAMASRSRLRARWRRTWTVPYGQPRTRAASSWV
ncbi:hypothetical protein [Aquisphaera giovannonii]|uniref:hypothetical protein n=1 Tax=Aquisphaera giovannonii TaxID=406548 RepID=UPI00143CE223|nr:hypothetical protein [Aquisphaera giovannonii]